MQVGQPSQDALVSFSDFLLEKFGLVASMQVAVVASIAFHTIAIVGLGFNLPRMMRDVAPRTFTRDAAALANTSDPESAPLMIDRPATYRGIASDPAATADTSDPGSVHVFRNSR